MILSPVNLLTYSVSQWYGKPKTAQLEGWYKELGITDGKGNPIHNGTDFSCPTGTPLVASIDGRFESYTSSDGALIAHIWGKDIRCTYIHLDKVYIKNGTQVRAGEVIGESGNSGRYSTNPHLHYAVYELSVSGQIKNFNNGSHGSVDPAPYLAKRLSNGSLVKTISEAKVYMIQNGVKWWIKDEKTFEEWFGIKVGKAVIEEIDLITYNFYRAGEIRFII